MGDQILGQGLLDSLLIYDVITVILEYVEEPLVQAHIVRPDQWPSLLGTKVKNMIANYIPGINVEGLCKALKDSKAVISGSSILYALGVTSVPPQDIDIFDQCMFGEPLDGCGLAVKYNDNRMSTREVPRWHIESPMDLFLERISVSLYRSKTATSVLKYQGNTNDREAYNQTKVPKIMRIMNYYSVKDHDGSRSTGDLESDVILFNKDEENTHKLQVIKTTDPPIEHITNQFDFKLVMNWFDGDKVHISHPDILMTKTVTSIEAFREGRLDKALSRLYKYARKGCRVVAEHMSDHKAETAPPCPVCHVEPIDISPTFGWLHDELMTFDIPSGRHVIRWDNMFDPPNLRPAKQRVEDQGS